MKYSSTQKNKSVADPFTFVRLSHLVDPVNLVEAIKPCYTRAVLTVFNYQDSKSNECSYIPQQRNELALLNLILCTLRAIDIYIYIYVYHQQIVFVHTYIHR